MITKMGAEQSIFEKATEGLDLDRVAWDWAWDHFSDACKLREYHPRYAELLPKEGPTLARMFCLESKIISNTAKRQVFNTPEN